MDVHEKNTVYKAIMDDDSDLFIFLIGNDDFDKDRRLKSILYPTTERGLSLLELCCYHGSIDCFRLLRTKFKSEITPECLQYSFLGGNQEIMNECLKVQKPNEESMKFAIISHNIDFVTFLVNEYRIGINMDKCGEYRNYQAFFVCLDLTHDINNCILASRDFHNVSLCEYFLTHGADVNYKDKHGCTYLYLSVSNRFRCETIEYILSHGADINSQNFLGQTPLHAAILSRNIDFAEFLISHGADINARTYSDDSVYNWANRMGLPTLKNLLISLGVDTSEPNEEKRCNFNLGFLMSHSDLF